MKITIIAVGKLKEKYWKEALAEYVRRLSAFSKLDVIELPDRGANFGSSEQIMQAEGEDILKAVQPLRSGGDAQIICLDARGVARSSVDLAKHIDQLKLRGKSRLAFIVGGSHGLSAEVLQQADEALSLGPQTWPHNLARVMLAEQIYRAFTISAGHPYHK